MIGYINNLLGLQSTPVQVYVPARDSRKLSGLEMTASKSTTEILDHLEEIVATKLRDNSDSPAYRSSTKSNLSSGIREARSTSISSRPLDPYSKSNDYNSGLETFRPARVLESITLLFSHSIKIILGYDPSSRSNNEKSNLQHEILTVQHEKRCWSTNSKSYEPAFCLLFEGALEKATALLIHQRENLNALTQYRIGLLVLGILTVFGIIFSKRTLSYVFFIASLVNLIYMVATYFNISVEQTRIANELKGYVIKLRDTEQTSRKNLIQKYTTSL